MANKTSKIYYRIDIRRTMEAMEINAPASFASLAKIVIALLVASIASKTQSKTNATRDSLFQSAIMALKPKS